MEVDEQFNASERATRETPPTILSPELRDIWWKVDDYLRRNDGASEAQACRATGVKWTDWETAKLHSMARAGEAFEIRASDMISPDRAAKLSRRIKAPPKAERREPRMLDDKTVAEIKRLRARGTSYAELAQMFGVRMRVIVRAEKRGLEAEAAP